MLIALRHMRNNGSIKYKNTVVKMQYFTWLELNQILKMKEKSKLKRYKSFVLKNN